MTIYELLKNSSPSMARHFRESEENTKKNTEDITKLNTRLNNLENGGSSSSITYYEKIIDSQVPFTRQERQIDNESCVAYYVRLDIDMTKDKIPYNPTFYPRCPMFLDYSTDVFYTEIPLLDYDNYEVFKHQNYTGFAISRQYNGEGFLEFIDLVITQETFNSLGQTSSDQPIRYKLYA